MDQLNKKLLAVCREIEQLTNKPTEITVRHHGQASNQVYGVGYMSKRNGYTVKLYNNDDFLSPN